MPTPNEKPQRSAPAAVSDLTSMMSQIKFSDVSGGAFIRAIPTPMFLLRHHPTAWRLSTTLGDPVLLPDVTMHIIAPGVNGVRTTNKGEAPSKAYEASVEKAEKDHWTYLSVMDVVPTHCLPDGVSGSYLQGIDCRNPITNVAGTRHVEAWTIPVATLPGEDQEFKFDLAKYELWLLWLVESGAIKPAMSQVPARLLKRAEGHRDRLYNMPSLAPEIRAARVAGREKLVAQYTAAQSNPVTPTEDKPKRRSR